MRLHNTLVACVDAVSSRQQGAYKPSGARLEWILPERCRTVFERSFGASFADVAAITGPDTDDRLAAAGALAQAVDGSTILLTSQWMTMPMVVRALLIGHELAHTLQLRRGGLDTEDCLEAEAWHAVRAALRGERYSITGGACKPLAAAAFVLDRMAVRYFQTFPQLLDLQVTQVREIRPMTFERVLQLMLSSDQKDFVIDVHGSAKGLSIPLARGTEIAAVKQSLVILLQIDHVQQAVREAGNDLRRWQRILRIIQAPQVDSVSQLGNARDSVEDWISRRVSALGLTAGRVNTLIQAMLELQGKDLRKIEFRSCKMGQDPDALHTFREFFEAKRVGAPDVRSGIATVNPYIGRGPMLALRRDHPQAEISTLPDGSRFGLRLRISPSPSIDVSSFAAADSWGAVRQWIARRIMGGTRYRSGGFPIHFLEADPPLFPADRAYRSHIKYSTHIWYTEDSAGQPSGTTESSFWERAIR